MSPRVVVVIPARFGSQRLPGKPLKKVAGRPLIEWVWRRAQLLQPKACVVVATDHPEIVRAVHRAGGEAVLTPGHFENGTERVAWVAQQVESDLVVNFQGDEPLVDITAVSRLIQDMLSQPAWQVATLAAPLRNAKDWKNPSVVKLLLNPCKQAVLFTRAPIPYFRSSSFVPLRALRRHIGVYVYRRPVLLQYQQWPVGELEAAEQLEQLRFLEQGIPFYVRDDARPSPGIDTNEDLQQFRRIVTKQGIEP